MDVLEALADHPRVRHITTRHEQGAAFMADVYGRLTGRSAVAMATLGPGATNLVTGVADAFLDRAPMVALTGQVGSDKLHKEAHQLIDIVQLFAPITKWNGRVERIDAIPEMVRKAFRIAALEKPGPTHIELPENRAQMPPESGDWTRPLVPRRTWFPEPTDEAVGVRGATASRAADRPIILAGNGVLRRRRLGQPAGPRPRPGHPGRGDVHGQGRHRRPGRAVADGRGPPGTRPRADRLRRVGPGHLRRLRPGRVRTRALEPGPHQAHPGHRHAALRGGRRYQPEVELVGDIDGSLERLLGALLEASGRAPTGHAAPAELRDALLADLRANAPDQGWPIKPQKAIADLRRALAPDDIVVCDVGAHKVWMARLYQAYEPNTVIISNGFAAMGIACRAPSRPRSCIPSARWSRSPATVRS